MVVCLSRLDNTVHLLAPERPPGPLCESCRLFLLADAAKPSRSRPPQGTLRRAVGRFSGASAGMGLWEVIWS
jgi:hypothetical protein